MEAFRLYMTKDGVWACNDLCYNYGTAHASLLKGYNQNGATDKSIGTHGHHI